MMTQQFAALISDRIGLIVMVLAFVACPMRAQSSTVVINEIMYHPVEKDAFKPDGIPLLDLTEDVHEYIELYNYGPSAIPLANWKLAGEVSYTFSEDAQIAPQGFLVVAKNKTQLAAIPQYGLTASSLFGPYSGNLSNKGGTIRLKNGQGELIDEVSYSSGFPWPIGADALGASDDWTGFTATDYQYRGRSLERVSATWSSNDPANWLASPIPGEPSPGRANSFARPSPLPVIISLTVYQDSDSQTILRKNQPVRIDAMISASNDLGAVAIEYFAEDINATNETTSIAPMNLAGDLGNQKFTSVLPGMPDRTIVRYRIRAQRAGVDEVVSPRPGDPFGWHAYFVTPVRTSTNPIYDLFVSASSLERMETNIDQNPRRVTLPDPPGIPRASWNAAEPAVFVYNGVVRDIRIRYHGSRYNRSVARQSYKFYFPRYNQLKNYSQIFETDKGPDTADAHGLFRAVGLPSSRTQTVDFYLNGNGGIQRLEQEEYDDVMLGEYRQDQQELNPGQPQLGIGELYKCEGVIESIAPAGEGPYGVGDGRLQGKPPYWTPLQMYEWTYALQDNGWKGHTAFQSMIEGMWAARADSITSRHPNIPALRDYFLKTFDVDKMLTYLAAENWMGPWDDTTQNHFLWQEADGKWAMLGWDFDYFFNDPTASLFAGEEGDRSNNYRGPNYFKDSFIKAFREELKQRFFLLNNTVLLPENITALGYGAFRGFAESRFISVNEQCGYGTFQRPNRPVPQSPANAVAILPPTFLTASSYSHSASPPQAQASATWEIRSASNTFNNPIFKVTSSTNLTSMAVPFAVLTFGQTYVWRVTYTDTNGHPSLPSDDSAFTFGNTTNKSGPNAISLNEIMADDRTPAPDWVELYNSSDSDQEIDGYGLSDDPFNPGRYIFPAGVKVPARGYLQVWCDTTTNNPGLHTGFGIDSSGETITLSVPNLGGFDVIDSVTIGMQAANRTVARQPDGVGSWQLAIPTPSATNKAQMLGPPTALKINEWMASPLAGDDWFELFNPSSLPISLENLFLSDTGNDPRNTAVPALSFIAPGGYVRFWADSHPAKGSDHVDFKLNASGDHIYLSSTNGLAIDSISFGQQKSGFSEGRIPDGSATISALAAPTPGAANIGGLRFDDIQVSGNGSVLRFLATEGRNYTVQYSDSFPAALWVGLRQVSGTNGLVNVTDSFAPGRLFRFYRIITSE